MSSIDALRLYLTHGATTDETELLSASDVWAIGTDPNIIALAGCSLDSSPGSNWVEKEGGLPEYICEHARAIMRGGTAKDRAIAIAVSAVKKEALTSKDPKVKAKAAAAVAQWEKMKAKTHEKKG